MNSRIRKYRKALVSPTQVAVLMLLATHAAHGQSTAAPPAAAASAAASEDVQQVTITATKRATSLQRTPLAVTALSATDLENAHVQTVQDIVHLVPSFQATTQGDHGVITMTLRGIGNDSAKTEYADPEVALFVDGIYSPRAEGAAALLFDMEGIEVLRGPQGTLWGRNSTVGAVNMKTAKPVLKDKFGSIEGGLGNYNRQGLRGAFNVPVGDTVALRFAFAHEQHDGYVDYQRAPHPSLAEQQAAFLASNPPAGLAFQPLNPNLFVQGGPKYNAQDQTAARISLLWKPTPAFSWNLSYEQFLDRGTPSMNLLQEQRPGEKFWSALIQVAPYLKRDVNTVRSRIDYDLGNEMSLSYIAGYSRYTGSSDFDQAGGATVPTSFTTGATYQQDRTNWSKYTNHSHELELQSTGTHTVDWILGLYYAAEDNGIRFDIPIMNGTQQGTVGWQGSFIQPKETVDSKAVFGQATWNVTDALHLTGGLRYTKDVRKNIGGRNWGWDGSDPLAPHVPVDPGLDPSSPHSGFGANPQHNDGRYEGSKTTYLARANYDVTKDFMVYASVSSGYKSGGLQDGGVPYGSETLTNYEVGTKNTFLGGRVRFNNALYYEKFKGFQFSAPVTNPDGTHSLATSNAEGAKVYGFESELAAKLTDNDRVQASFAYTHTELGHLIGGSNDYRLPTCTVPGISTCLDVTGNQLPHAPKFAAQVMYEHTFQLGNGDTLAPRISVHYETASWLSVFNMGDPDRQKAYSRTDLGLRYASSKDWWVDLFVRNAENGKVKTSAQNAFGPWQAQYLPPRTYGLNAGVSF
ncbi:TonB-dependent receptor [Ideonella sp. BN130291]|uniref:TonB-dependent receptor n=1 Tax=Ideonella sp. BN130291 TaxID=3112940 RepID=UPI002E2749B8|nr:TonB-dependent receptor [Ideonella sp. BN130291]